MSAGPTAPERTMGVGAVVLAGGAASRFGGPKQLALLDGRPVIDHVLEALEHRAVVRRVVVVGAHATMLASALAGRDGLDVRRCPRWADGPARSLRTGLDALAGLDWALVLLGDEVRLPGAAVDRLLQAILQAPRASAARATWCGRSGHPVLLHRSRWPELEQLPPGAGARRLFDRPGALHIACEDLGTPLDIDVPEDLERAARPVT